MLERELKFHVPPTSRDAVERELQRLDAKIVPLHARYFDTVDDRLARSHIALRLRQEGPHWVQTIKMPGPDELTRIELNHDRPVPTLDLSVYQGTELEGVLAQFTEALVLRYETRISRLVTQLHTDSGIIELAYDCGLILAGKAQCEVNELELEHIQGEVADLFYVATQWLETHGLILDFRSKAERGNLLARSRSLLEAHKSKSSTAPSGISLQALYSRSAGECLSQIVRNAALLAGVQQATPSIANRSAYVHQLRVGIRRLRSCWRLFTPWLTPARRNGHSVLLQCFLDLGSARDHDVVHAGIAGKLCADGMPDLVGTHDSARKADISQQHAQDIAASVQLQKALLELLEDLLVPHSRMQAYEKPARGKMIKRLNKWLKQIQGQGQHFAQLTETAQHDLRKKAKRLRYDMEFCAGLLEVKSANKVCQALSQVQDVLGDLNDFHLAYQHYLPLTATQPQAWFAVGWLRASQAHKQKQAQNALEQLARTGPLKKRKAARS